MIIEVAYCIRVVAHNGFSYQIGLPIPPKAANNKSLIIFCPKFPEVREICQSNLVTPTTKRITFSNAAAVGQLDPTPATVG